MAMPLQKKMLTLDQAESIHRSLCLKIEDVSVRIAELTGNPVKPFTVDWGGQRKPLALRHYAELCTKASRRLDNLRDELDRLENHVESEADRLLRNLAERHAIKIKR